MLTRRTVLLAPGLLALAGCQPPTLDVDVSGSPGAIKFSAHRGDGPFGLFSEPAPIGRLSVSLWRTEPRQDVWNIEISNTCQLDVFQMQYGFVPDGFAQTMPPQALTPDEIYLVVIEGCAVFNSPGVAFFKVSNNRVRHVGSEERERIMHGAS